MTAAGRQDANGGAPGLSLFAAITDPAALTLQVSGTVTGWIFARNFTITVDPNTPSEEHMLCSTIVGSNPATITVVTRGYDGSIAVTHGQGAAVQHTFPATIVMDVERHIYVTAEDDHTQYLNSARHASPTLHDFGSPGSAHAYGVGTTAPADVGTTAAAGSGAAPARDDHRHKIGTGAVNVFGMFAAGVVGLAGEVAVLGGAAAAGTIDKFARIDHQHPVADGSIPFAKLLIADGAISGLKLTDATVTRAKILWGPYGRISLVGQAPNVSGSTLTVMHFDTTDYDADNLFVSTSRFQVPTGGAGPYRLTACLAWPADGATMTRRYIGLRVNGATIIADDSRNSVTVPSGVGTSSPVSATYRLAVADYVEVICRQDSAGTMTLPSSAASHFSAEFIRPT